MLIKEIYIENFGKLSSLKLKLTEGLNTVCRENGFGKTTLTAFIKAMFFGLEDTKRSSLLDNERKRYLPWQGGAFGGYLVFDDGEKEYRIERSFGAKASDDVFAIYDTSTGLASEKYTDNIGNELFGIDADGFERTVFLSERNLSGKNENQTISAKLSDLVGVSGDVGDFDQAMDILDKRRKFYRLNGGRGEIQNLENQHFDLLGKISEAERIYSEKPAEEARLNAEREAHDMLCQRRRELTAERRTSEIAGLERAKIAALDSINAQIAEEKDKLDRYSDFFSKKMPTQKELEEISAYSGELRRLKELRESGIYENQEEVSPFIRIPERDELGKYREMAEFVPVHKKAVSKSLILFGILAILAGALLGAFIAPMLFFVSLLGIIPIILFFYVKAKAKKDYEQQMRRCEEYTTEITEFIKSVTGKDHYGDPRAGLEGLVKALEEYESGRIRREALREAKEKQEKEELCRISLLEERICSFLGLFPLSEGMGVRDIERMLAEYEAAKRSLESRISSAEGFKKENGLTGSTVTECRSTAEIDEELAITETAIVARQRSLEAIGGIIASCDKARELATSLSEELSVLESRIAKAKGNLAAITRARALLQRAKDNMTSRYLKGAKEGFEKYIGLLDSDGGEYSIDTRFTVMKSDQGKSRQTEAYSRGTRDLYALCIRLSLADALYEGELPPLILDDPFISFDDARIEEGLKLLEALGKSRQIIYMTCSAARAN